MDLLNESNSLGDEINSSTKINFADLAKWLKITALLAFVSLVLSILNLIVDLNKVNVYGLQSIKDVQLFSTIITVGFSLLLNIILINAALQMEKGLKENNQLTFTLGISNLAKYFKIMGIFTIVIIVGAILFVVGFGFFTGFRKSY